MRTYIHTRSLLWELGPIEAMSATLLDGYVYHFFYIYARLYTYEIAPVGAM